MESQLHDWGTSPAEQRKHGSPFPFDTRCMHEPRQVIDSINAMNQLAGVKFKDLSQPLGRPPTKVQSTLLEHLKSCLQECEACPDDMTYDSALRELTKDFAPYDGMPNHLANYDFDKIKVLHSSVRPKNVIDLLPDSIKPLIRNFKNHVVRDPQQVQAELASNPEAMPKQPYWDPALKTDSSKRLRLFKRMFDIGLLDLQPVIRAKAGIFCVKKKDPRYIRLIIDGRQANFMHRRPPTTRLGSSTCLSEIRMPENKSGVNQAYAQECDVSDCFYQFRIDEAGAFFGLDVARSLDEWSKWGMGVDSVYDYNLGARRQPQPDEKLFPVISAMSMGWSWALYLANETVASIVAQSSPSPLAELRERRPCPQLDEHSTISSAYVDNVTIIGRTAEDVSARAQLVDQAFKDLGIPIVWTQPEPTPVIESVGCVLDFNAGIIRNKPRRVWRVHKAGLALASRSRVRIEHVEIWLGHITSLFRLRPCLLSIFDKIYRFVDLDRGLRVPLWPSVRKEIKLASHLVWMARTNLKAKFVQQLDAGDSANHGYAMMTRPTTDWEIARALKFREKWRFIPLPHDVKEALTQDDKQRLCELLAQKSGVSWDPNHEFGAGHSLYSLGLDTQYGQWLQQALSEGDWLKTSAIQSQLKARGKNRDDIDCPSLVEPVSSSLLDPEKYKLLWAKRWKDPSHHINYKEGLVALSSLKRTARVDSLTHSTKLTLSDNLCVVLAFEKGRSNSPSINRLCRVAAALQIGLDIHWRLRHIESPRNVADAPSRWFEKGRRPEQWWIDYEPSSKSPNNPKCSVLSLRRALGDHHDLSNNHPPPGLGVFGETKIHEKPKDQFAAKDLSSEAPNSLGPERIHSMRKTDKRGIQEISNRTFLTDPPKSLKMGSRARAPFSTSKRASDGARARTQKGGLFNRACFIFLRWK